jgi:eukaryotic-like serine/threonine-protein kinase
VDSKSVPAADVGTPSESAGPAERLTRLWQQGAEVDLDAFLGTAGPLSEARLAEVVRVDQRQRWQAGERVVAEHYLRRYPDLGTSEEAAVDIIFNEFRLRDRLGENPQLQEYVDRFPAYAEILASQIAFNRALGAYQSAAEEADNSGSAESSLMRRWPQDTAASERIGIVARERLSSDHEIRSLLRRRLRLVSTISFVGFLLYVPVLWSLFTRSWGTVLYVAVTTEAAAIALLMSSNRAFSLRSLRWFEASLFLGLLGDFGYAQIQFFHMGFYSSIALNGSIGAALAARSISWSWAVTIIGYGILIPNTARRCLVAVSIMGTGFVAISTFQAFEFASLSQSAAVAFVLCSMTDMMFAGTIAVFGAHRIATLQRAVAEARRLGPYRLIRRLGAGGMGEVYLAEHALLRRPCALKLIRPERVGDAHAVSRFEREAQAMANLTHPNTVRLYDYGVTADGVFYYAMECLPGCSLENLVNRHGPVEPQRAIHLLRQICGALHEAHAAGLVHRDIKPANILACRVGAMHDVAKLLDFGLVRVHSLGSDDTSLTGVGTIAGTPAFMSPEQAAAKAIDNRSDIYSLGAVAYYLLTGRAPFVHATSVQTMAAHLSETVVPPRELNSNVSSELEAIVLRCLEKEPERRFQDVSAVEETLILCAGSDAWTAQQASDWWATHGSSVSPGSIGLSTTRHSSMAL